MLIRGWLCCGLLVMGGGAFGQQTDGALVNRVAVVSDEAGQAAGGQGAEGQAGVGLDGVGQPTTVSGVLRGLASRAAVVFVGQVQSIVPKAGVVEVTFTVQQPVMGSVGATYVMREWAGRWTGGQQRYRMGQRAMFFLHAPSAAGLSSPVDGMAGVVPLISMGADVDPLLDVRLLAARAERPVGSRMVDAELGAVALSDARAAVANWRVVEQTEVVGRPLPAGVRPVSVEMPAVHASAVVHVSAEHDSAEQSGDGREVARAQR